MMTTRNDLSEAEQEALLLLHREGALLTSKVPDKTERCHMGFIEPGLAVYRKLERKGLALITEEDPVTFEDEEGQPFDFTFTPQIELTDTGLAAIKKF